MDGTMAGNVNCLQYELLPLLEDLYDEWSELSEGELFNRIYELADTAATRGPIVLLYRRCPDLVTELAQALYEAEVEGEFPGIMQQAKDPMHLLEIGLYLVIAQTLIKAADEFRRLSDEEQFWKTIETKAMASYVAKGYEDGYEIFAKIASDGENVYKVAMEIWLNPGHEYWTSEHVRKDAQNMVAELAKSRGFEGEPRRAPEYWDAVEAAERAYVSGKRLAVRERILEIVDG